MAKNIAVSNFCAAKLQNLWQEKEYRNIPVVVLDYLTSDASISDGAALCWMQLFKMAYFDNDWSIQIPKSEIAKTLRKSIGSIKRYLNELEQANYINTKEVRINGVWAASKIYISVPSALFEQLSHAPARKTSSTPRKEEQRPAAQENYAQKENKRHTETFHVEQENNTTLTEKRPPESNNPIDHICTSGRIRSDLSNNNIYINNKYINNNRDISSSNNNIQKNTVVSFSKKCDVLEFNAKQQAKIDNLKTKISDLDNKLKPLSEKYKILPLHEKRKFYDMHMKHLYSEKSYAVEALEEFKLTVANEQKEQGRLGLDGYRNQRKNYAEAKLARLRSNKIEYTREEIGEIQILEKEILDLSNLEKRAEYVRENNFLSQQGKRPISEREKQYLLQKIAGLGLQGERAIELANEIAFQVRFGSLQKSYKTGKEMTIQNSLNIALLAVREARWSRPMGMSRVA